jgi:hypothetical protein
MIDRLKDPIFFIGFPRSGTTIIFEAFVRNPEFGWLANYSEMWPGAIAANILCRLLDNRLVRLRGRKKQYGSVRFGNRLLPQPVEAYAFWDHYTGINFSHDYLMGQKADKATCRIVREALQKTMWYQNKTRFTTKLTGPGRIGYLLSIFPDARFVHVIRDGRAVVESLLRVDFWHAQGGMEAPFWTNGLDAASLADWEQSDRDPIVLAAHQWKRIIETTRDESSNLNEKQYSELKYEDFVKSPQTAISELLLWAGNERNAMELEAEKSGAGLGDMNRKYLDIFSRKQIATLNRIMGTLLVQLDYSL